MAGSGRPWKLFITNKLSPGLHIKMTTYLAAWVVASSCSAPKVPLVWMEISPIVHEGEEIRLFTSNFSFRNERLHISSSFGQANFVLAGNSPWKIKLSKSQIPGVFAETSDKGLTRLRFLLEGERPDWKMEASTLVLGEKIGVGFPPSTSALASAPGTAPKELAAALARAWAKSTDVEVELFERKKNGLWGPVSGSQLVFLCTATFPTYIVTRDYSSSGQDLVFAPNKLFVTVAEVDPPEIIRVLAE